MSDTNPADPRIASWKTNFIQRGVGRPIILVHGLAASLHDWEFLMPPLAAQGYAAYAVDLLGHGDSAKPEAAAYEMKWLSDHFANWMNSQRLAAPAVLIGHSLGGYIVLEQARRHPEATRALVLVDPLYTFSQIPGPMQAVYSHPGIRRLFGRATPQWLVRAAIDVASLFMGHSAGGIHALPSRVRAQTAADYRRTASAAYAAIGPRLDFTPHLPAIHQPALIVWGEQDRTLSVPLFKELVQRLPDARGVSIRTGHVPHQADAEWFNARILDFLRELEETETQTKPVPAGLPGPEDRL